jgi:glycosyltransferase involved in cell wall biosynthesis
MTSEGRTSVPPLRTDTTTIVIGTFGGDDWKRLARGRAIPSAMAQGCRVVHVHADTLHDARNTALDQVETPWVIHLDADDELEPGYVANMMSADGDVRAPMVRYVQRGRAVSRPRFPRVAGHSHECSGDCLPYGNWIVIGAAVRTDLVRQVGGWRDFVWSEDWDMWLRCYLSGAEVRRARRAIYRAHVRSGSRNRSRTSDERLAAHRAIAAANGAPIP